MCRSSDPPSGVCSHAAPGRPSPHISTPRRRRAAPALLGWAVGLLLAGLPAAAAAWDSADWRELPGALWAQVGEWSRSTVGFTLPASPAPALLAVVGAVAVGTLLLRVVRHLRRPGAPSAGRLRRAARRALRRGDHLEAARMLLESGEPAAAASAFEQGGAFLEAGRIWEGEGKLGKAARAYEQGGNAGRAADLYAQLGQPARAASLYQRDGQVTRAAEAFARAGDLPRAADLFIRCEAFARAGEILLTLGRDAEAADLLERDLARRRAAKEADGNAAALEAAARQCAAAHAKAGRPARAAAVLRAQGLDLDAAEHCAAAGDWEAALEILLRHQAFERAAALCRSLKKDVELSRVEGEQHAAAGREAEAAGAFERAGLWWRAADSYQRAGDFAKAAEMATAQGDLDRAAEMSVAAGRPAEAAAILERLGRAQEAAEHYRAAGRLQDAARILLGAGDGLAAGQLYLTLGADEEAMRAFQQVAPETPDYFEATVALGDLFLGRELLGPAREKFERGLSLRQVGPAILHPAYQLARVHERQGNAAEAIRLLERVVAERFDYRDARERLVALRRPPAASPPPSAEASTRLIAPPPPPRYRTLRELGRGGMGIVYEAEDGVLARRVAYKVLTESLWQDAKAVDEFLREARIAASLHHPNIVTVFDAGQEGDRVYIAMEFLEGRSVDQLLDTAAGPLPMPQAVEIARQACQGLVHAHAQRVVHRDVKPANMMLTPAGLVKLMDFGLAAVMSRVTAKVTSIRGTPFYMAPEQILGASASPAADQYALGSSLYHMLTGRPPFVEGDVLYHHIHTEPEGPRERNPAVPVWLSAIVLRAMRKRPEERFPSIAALLAAVEECLRSVRSGPFLPPRPR